MVIDSILLSAILKVAMRNIGRFLIYLALEVVVSAATVVLVLKVIDQFDGNAKSGQ